MCMTVSIEIVFWLSQLYYFLIDHFNLMPSYRIEKKQPYPSRKLVLDAIKEVLIDHWITRPCALFVAYPLFAWRLDFGLVLPDMWTA